jgi:hypothetical protein
MAEQRLSDFERARRKAAQRIGVADKRCWPDNSEIQDALLEHYRLFHYESQQQVRSALHARALAAMETFAEFQPRLVGQSARGVASRDQGVRLHLFADDPTEIAFRLVDRGIPWQERESQLRYASGERVNHPVFAFVAGEIPVELIVLPPQARRNPPLSPVSERPERGLDAGEVARLLADEDDRALP